MAFIDKSNRKNNCNGLSVLIDSTPCGRGQRAGLHRDGSAKTCFMNVVFNLFRLLPFQKLLYTESAPEHREVLRELRALAVAMEFSQRRVLDPEVLIKTLLQKLPLLSMTEEEDVTYFFQMFVNLLWPRVLETGSLFGSYVEAFANDDGQQEERIIPDSVLFIDRSLLVGDLIPACERALSLPEVFDDDQRPLSKPKYLSELPKVFVVSLQYGDRQEKIIVPSVIFLDSLTNTLRAADFRKEQHRIRKEQDRIIHEREETQGFKSVSNELKQELRDLKATMQEHKYKLSAFFVHGGSDVSGHYWAFINKDGIWLECDDGRCDEVSEETVTNALLFPDGPVPYVLFYTPDEGLESKAEEIESDQLVIKIAQDNERVERLRVSQALQRAEALFHQAQGEGPVDDALAYSVLLPEIRTTWSLCARRAAEEVNEEVLRQAIESAMKFVLLSPKEIIDFEEVSLAVSIRQDCLRKILNNKDPSVAEMIPYIEKQLLTPLSWAVADASKTGKTLELEIAAVLMEKDLANLPVKLTFFIILVLSAPTIIERDEVTKALTKTVQEMPQITSFKMIQFFNLIVRLLPLPESAESWQQKLLNKFSVGEYDLFGRSLLIGFDRSRCFTAFTEHFITRKSLERLGIEQQEGRPCSLLQPVVDLIKCGRSFVLYDSLEKLEPSL